MKKIIGLILMVLAIGGSVIGCNNKQEIINQQPQQKQEEQVKKSVTKQSTDDVMNILVDSDKIEYASMVEFNDSNTVLVDVQVKNPKIMKEDVEYQNKINNILFKDFKHVQWIIRNTGNNIIYNYTTNK